MTTLNHRPEILSVLKEVAKDKGFKDCQITKVVQNGKGEGYLGELYMVTINNKLDVVVKAAFVDTKIREAIPIRLTFENEIFFYKKILPMLKKLQPKLDFIPSCLKVSTENQQEMLILENLKSLNFEVFDKTQCLDDEHVSLIFETYGKLHGLSFVLRDQQPEEFRQLEDGMHNIWNEFITNDMFSTHTIEMSKIVQNILIPGEDDILIKKYKKYVGEGSIKRFKEIVNATPKSACIIHGDCWSNNMLFRYHQKKPSELRLIDFQCIKVGSPVCDLSYCLYSGASKKVLDNLNEHLETYHKSFSKCVREFGCDPEELFPFSTLKEHWKKYSIFGMIMGFALWRMKLVDKDDIVDLTDGNSAKEMTEVLLNTKFDEDGFAKRVRWILWHLSEIDTL